MILKIVLLFLVGMAILAMLGRLRFPGQSKTKSHLFVARNVDISRSVKLPATALNARIYDSAIAKFRGR